MPATKDLYQIGSAFGTGVIAEYTKRASTPTLGIIMAAALGAVGYLLAPTARGDMIPVTVGLMDGAASWLGANLVAPVLKTKTAGLFGGRAYSVPAPVPAFVPAGASRSILEI